MAKEYNIPSEAWQNLDLGDLTDEAKRDIGFILGFSRDINSAGTQDMIDQWAQRYYGMPGTEFLDMMQNQYNVIEKQTEYDKIANPEKSMEEITDLTNNMLFDAYKDTVDATDPMRQEIINQLSMELGIDPYTFGQGERPEVPGDYVPTPSPSGTQYTQPSYGYQGDVETGSPLPQDWPAPDTQPPPVDPTAPPVFGEDPPRGMFSTSQTLEQDFYNILQNMQGLAPYEIERAQSDFSFGNPAESFGVDPFSTAAYQSLMQGADPILRSTYAQARGQAEDAYSQAKEGVMSTAPRGGALTSALSDVEQGRARNLSDISMDIASQQAQMAMGLGTGIGQEMRGLQAAQEFANFDQANQDKMMEQGLLQNESAMNFGLQQDIINEQKSQAMIQEQMHQDALNKAYQLAFGSPTAASSGMTPMMSTYMNNQTARDMQTQQLAAQQSMYDQQMAAANDPWNIAMAWAKPPTKGEAQNSYAMWQGM